MFAERPEWIKPQFVIKAIRLFIFDNRIEIISPGHLPNNLTVEKIRNGNSNIRNPILVSYVAKGLLPSTVSAPASNVPWNNGRRSNLPTTTTVAFFGSP